MARSFVLGNGEILVDLDSNGQVRDFYYPYVGQENHVNGNVHKVGLWVDGKFSWLDDSSWKRSRSYKKETLVTDILSEQRALGITLRTNDIVHYNKNIFLRKVTVTNTSNKKKDIRLFFHQHFSIFESNSGETVYYHPFIDALIDYKGKRYFLINGMFINGTEQGISSYATGLTDQYGLQGTFIDAQDGKLSGNSIEHGSVDSTISFNFPLQAKSSKEVYYWICVGKNFTEVSNLNSFIKKVKPSTLLDETEKYWRGWVNKTPFDFFDLKPEVVDLFKCSLFVIRSHVDNHGSIIASSDSDMLFMSKDSYSYMWPRDGALIARSLDRAGYSNITESFFKFCSKVLTVDGYLFHKYNPDMSLGSSWHSWLDGTKIQLPIQEDQNGLILDALWKHFEQHNVHKTIITIMDSFIRRSADFLVSFIDEKTGLPRASYDLWEEKLGMHTFTCSAVYAGLQAAAKFEDIFGTKIRAKKYRSVAEGIKKAILTYLYDDTKGYFIKSVYYDGDELKRDTTLDASSCYGIYQFKVLPVDDEMVLSSFDHFKQSLSCKTAIGGYARYIGDSYHKVTNDVPGNPWIITSLWLAEYYITKAKTKEEIQPALAIFDWVVKSALDSGMLPEQLHPITGEPLSVAPLSWSHAGFVIAINKYLEKLDTLGICGMCNPPKFNEKG